jgi:hypothetical protein
MPRKRQKRTRPLNDLRHMFDSLPFKLDMGALVARQIGLHDTELLSPFMAILAITKAESPTAFDVCNNGTGALVDTGERTLLITNHHVYEAFIRNRKETSCTKLVMSGVDGRPFVNISDEEWIGSDSDCDLATLAISPAKVDQQGKQFYRASWWPPERPRKGTRVVVVGYPGQGRHASGEDTLQVRPLSVGRRVSSISEKQFVMADETQDAYNHVPHGQSPLTSYGGLSGSPAFSVHRLIGGADGYRLCGFVREEGIGHTLIVAHADHINADGTLR